MNPKCLKRIFYIYFLISKEKYPDYCNFLQHIYEDRFFQELLMHVGFNAVSI